MFKLWMVIALFFVGGAVGFTSWMADFLHHREFAAGGAEATAGPVGRNQKPGRSIVILDESRYEFPLRFNMTNGQGVTTMAYVPQRALDAIAKDGTTPIIYSRDDPKRVVFPGDLERMPKGYGSLLFGLVSLLVGIGLISIRHRLIGPAGHLRFGDGGAEE